MMMSEGEIAHDDARRDAEYATSIFVDDDGDGASELRRYERRERIE